ncbi:hypothetical protein [Pelagimonas phthalicica]|uniref:hypothetical protein n=1 Tax=Pelagimonas phthalicica TaxID=1037362 RepID=UPI0010617E44|nr:hypothetical protein [Pelagimonas phthalicica]
MNSLFYMSILRASNLDANSEPKNGCVGEAQAIMVILIATKGQWVNGSFVRTADIRSPSLTVLNCANFSKSKANKQQGRNPTRLKQPTVSELPQNPPNRKNPLPKTEPIGLQGF